MRMLVSACLLGLSCRYDGKSRPCDALLQLAEEHELIPICPEQLGGLPTPRPASERQGERVINREGADVTAAYQKGAEEALRLCETLHCACAILKERSPSCGCGTIYDGTFTGTLTQGDGVTAQRLKGAGIRVVGESQISTL
jgi:uncharacterized protein YbbK (DUF523 family)